MNNATNFHRAFGVYGICIENNHILVIDKMKGPYRNRYDLPGGSLEDGEALLAGLHREIKEETGLNVTVVKQIGTIDFQFPSKFKEYTHVHHIAVFYGVERCGGELKYRNNLKNKIHQELDGFLSKALQNAIHLRLYVVQ